METHILACISDDNHNDTSAFNGHDVIETVLYVELVNGHDDYQFAITTLDRETGDERESILLTEKEVQSLTTALEGGLACLRVPEIAGDLADAVCADLDARFEDASNSLFRALKTLTNR